PLSHDRGDGVAAFLELDGGVFIDERSDSMAVRARKRPIGLLPNERTRIRPARSCSCQLLERNVSRIVLRCGWAGLAGQRNDLQVADGDRPRATIAIARDDQLNSIDLA